MRDSIARANRGFAAWVSARSYRLVPLIVVGLLVFPPLAWALLILDVLRRGTAAALMSVLIACLGLAAAGAIGGASLGATLAVSLPALAAGLVLGVLLGWARGLTLAFQATVLGSILIVLVLFTLFPAANAIGELILNELIEFLGSVGRTEAELEEFRALDPRLFALSFLFSLEAMLLGALMLGYWWYSLLQEGVRFGAEFRSLKLGRVAGIGLMLLVTLDLLVGAGAIEYAASMAVVGFLFQGLSVLHARSHSDHWHWAVVFLVYLLLVPVTLLSGVVVMGLSTVGLLDNFFGLRAPAKPR